MSWVKHLRRVYFAATVVLLLSLVNRQGLSLSIFDLSPAVVALQSSAVFLLAVVWSRLMVGETHLSLVSAYVRAQLLKYLPIGVGNIAALIFDTSGLAARTVSMTAKRFAVAVTLISIGAATLSLAVIHWALFPVALAIASLLLSLTDQQRGVENWTQVRSSLLPNLWLSTAAVLLVSLSFALHVHNLNVLDMEPTAKIVASFAMSWLAGLVAVIAPAGLGVREAGLAFLFADALSISEAIEVSIGHRIHQTVAEIVCVILVAGLRLYSSVKIVMASNSRVVR